MKATDLLARQEQSSQVLKQKLLLRGYTETDTQAAIQRLISLGYLNDAEACRRQFEFLYEDSRQSVRQICRKLLQRGFSHDQIEACIPAETATREMRAAKRSLALKFKEGAEPRRMMQHLYLKGFPSEICRQAAESFGAEADS